MTQLTQEQLDSIQTEADKLMGKLDIPEKWRSELVNLMVGTVTRTQHAVNNGEKLTEELITAATIHTHESNMKMYDDLLHNVDGAFDKLSERVYEEIKATL